LRFDGTGGADDIAKLIEAAGNRKLEPEEIKRLQEAFRNHKLCLGWARGDMVLFFSVKYGATNDRIF